MAEFAWTPKYSVNISKIDQQHSKFIDILNNLNMTLKKGEGREIIDKIIAELEDYADFHFKTEEDLFKKYDYPEYVEHKKEHDDFKKKVKEFLEKSQNQKSGKVVLTIEISNFMLDWLINHILKSDKKFGPYLNSKGIY